MTTQEMFEGFEDLRNAPADIRAHHAEHVMDAGVEPESDEARAAAEAMRQLITRCFYPCSPEMHAGLADMYEADARFRGHYEKRAAGLAAYAATAIRANARTMEA